jgi:ethanolamine utilization protein EutQ
VKRLITVNEIKKLCETGKKELCIEPGTIITPAARDTAEEYEIKIKEGSSSEINTNEVDHGTEKAKPVNNQNNSDSIHNSAVDPNLIAKIVREVMKFLPGSPKNLVKEADPSGLRLVKGNSIVCERFNTGNPNDKVGIKEILTIKESPNMASGFMTLEDTSFSWDLKYEEIDYIVEGTLEMTVNGKTYRGEAGDVFYLPKDTTVTFSTPNKVKFFFVTYPANWAELSNYEK